MSEARNNLARLIKQAQDADIVITRRGRPVAQLVAISSAPGRELVEWLGGNSLPQAAHRSDDEIDAAIAEARELGMIYSAAIL